MLRTLVFALAIGLPGLAAAEPFPHSAQDVEVRGDDGTVIGRVSAVERNADGEIVAVEIPGMEPGNASDASSDLVAQNERQPALRVRNSGERPRQDERAIFDRRVLR
ncbi:hypothetical protein [Candidatus Viadribacter manganicus]|uniref:PRC-barrel domain-containing protein n=1 Tax=Candidatus Viadribacter manganicus TaxID=1759059 RepID=A0A1B1AF15_9PROT|nr:hypothetical protein [Candidatus Viadribacter manganicus]ANP45166.1 hypothetical protein ATE48_04165 [Candidatus Viadribacter manganicus]